MPANTSILNTMTTPAPIGAVRGSNTSPEAATGASQSLERARMGGEHAGQPHTFLDHSACSRNVDVIKSRRSSPDVLLLDRVPDHVRELPVHITHG